MSEDIPTSEAAVIGRAIQSGGAFLDEVSLSPDDFSVTEAALAWAAMQKMALDGTPIDAVSLGIAERRAERYAWLALDAPIWSAEYHADHVKEQAVRRRVRTGAQALLERAGTMPVQDLLDYGRQQMDEASGLRRPESTFVGDVIDEVLGGIGQPRRTLATPWQHVNGTLGGGLRPGALYILAGRPGLSKSSLALQIATEMSRSGLVGFFSLEMPREELIRRLISQGSRVPHHALDSGRPLNEFALTRIENWRKNFFPASIAIDDRSMISLSDVRAHARQLARQGEMAGVVLDYLQLMPTSGDQKRHEAIGEMTRQLKIMAREMDMPVVVLSQLNRNSEARADKRPQLSDLRESGSIEQDADVVVLLHRDADAAADLPAYAPVPMEFIVAKNRHGPTQMHEILWDGQFMRADEYTEH